MTPRLRRSPLLLAWAALALAALFALVVEDSFLHTDDGCGAVERHCLACRALQGGAPLPAARPMPSVQLAPAEAVAPEAGLLLEHKGSRTGASRAPPLA